MVDATQTKEPTAADNDVPRKFYAWTSTRRLAWLSALIGALVFGAWALQAGWPSPVSAPDIDQHRLNHALAPPGAGESIVQTFRPRHDSLHEVELLLARGGQQPEAEGVDAKATLTLRLFDERGAEIASRSWPTRQLRHNQPLALQFPPQAQSAERQFRLVLEGSDGNPYGVWAYDLDVYANGEMQALDDAQALAGDLRFTTGYRLMPRATLGHLRDALVGGGATLLLGLLLLPLPGALALLAARRWLPTLDSAAWWGLACALGIALWPLLWFWPTLAGARWTRTSLTLVVILGWFVALLLFFRRRSRAPVPPHYHTSQTTSHTLHDTLLLLLLTLALAVRLLAIRDLAFPPWVDSSRHALITALMTQSGQTPTDYRPLLPVDDFAYHFGFHTLSAGVQMILGGDLRQTLPRVLLVLGQLLNTLSALTVYAAAWLVTRRRGAALLAAFMVALPFFFPAYYLTWGRYTQLSGALLLAPLVALTWLLVRGARGWRRVWWLVALLAAGLFLVHVRVFLVYVVFAILISVTAWTRQRPLGRLRGLLAAALLAAFLAGPRLWQLTRDVGARGYLTAADRDYASFPLGYVTTGWERWFLSAGGLALLLLVFVALRRGVRRGHALLGLVLAGWAALSTLWLSGNLPGIPALWLINLNSAYILMFVPLALLLALAFSFAWPRALRRTVGPARVAAALAVSLLFGVAVAACTLFGARQQITILNETTILAREADEGGLKWVAQNLSPDARVAVNSWRWLGATWAAGDGGAWLLPLTGVEPTTPPVDYIGDRELFLEVIAFNEAATAVVDWSAPEAADWLEQERVTHVFVGARGGFLDPAALSRNSRLQMRYGHDGVFVFELRNEGDER